MAFFFTCHKTVIVKNYNLYKKTIVYFNAFSNFIYSCELPDPKLLDGY